MSLTPEQARRPGQPLLSITIPTFRRAPYLRVLLRALAPQLAAVPADDVELLISDNASPDDTVPMVQTMQAAGLRCRLLRNEENVGADANFLQCVNEARGVYAWVLGDDDVVLPGTLAALVNLLSARTVDLVYLSSVGFTGEFDGATLQTADKLGRFAEVVEDAGYFLEKVNALLGLISAVIFNRERLLATPHPSIAELNGTNLVQMGWLLPLVRPRMTVLYIWQRQLAYRSFNSTEWGICEVFGVRLHAIAQRYLAAYPQLPRALTNGTLRYWMMDSVYTVRTGQQAEMTPEHFTQLLQPVFGGNWRYWVFVWPVAAWPLPLARLSYAVLKPLNRMTRIVQGVWRHHGRHGEYLDAQGMPWKP